MRTNISRRKFMAAGASLMAATQLSNTTFAAAITKPNVLLIHVDQHRFDCLGVAGNKDVRTPNIDALAKDGIHYENSFCSFPVCTPSRYSLLSGQYVWEHKGWSNHCTLHPDIPTFPKVLRDAEYKTKAVGKMHFTPTYLDVGFEAMELSEQNGPGRWDDDYHRYLKERDLYDHNDLEDQVNEYRKEAPPSYWDSCGARASNLPEEHHSTTWVAGRAMETLDQWSAGGNLLMAGFIKPHHPFDPPASWCDKYDPEALSILPGWTDQCLERDMRRSTGFFPHETLTEPVLQKAMAYYYAMIEQIDFHVGRMVQRLKEKGLYDNTMIIFTGDHGEYMGFHHMLLKGNHLYDPLAKVPLIIKYPKQARKGTATTKLVNNIDVAPTILKQAGLNVPDSMSGLDLMAKIDRDIVFSETGGSEVMARTDRYKLILVPARNRHYFFDLKNDPYELDDQYVNTKYKKEIKRLIKALENWRPLDVRQRAYLDENAPEITRPNVPKRNDGHREAMQTYFRGKMTTG